jgi:opacity protein-like surface antigen
LGNFLFKLLQLFYSNSCIFYFYKNNYGGLSLKKLFFISVYLLATSVFAQSQNFAGLSISFDYSDNGFSDTSTPGGHSYSQNGVPSLTAQYYIPVDDRFVAGPYATYDLVNTDTSHIQGTANHPLEAGAKIGYAINDSWLAYAKLGYSWSQFVQPDGYDSWMRGPSYGLGIDYMATEHILLRAEISQQNYNTLHWSDGSSDKCIISSYGVSIGYRF